MKKKAPGTSVHFSHLFSLASLLALAACASTPQKHYGYADWKAKVGRRPADEGTHKPVDGIICDVDFSGKTPNYVLNAASVGVFPVAGGKSRIFVLRYNNEGREIASADRVLCEKKGVSATLDKETHRYECGSVTIDVPYNLEYRGRVAIRGEDEAFWRESPSGTFEIGNCMKDKLYVEKSRL